MIKATIVKKKLHLEKRKDIFSTKKLIMINKKRMIPNFSYVKKVIHLLKDRGWFITQTVSFGIMTAAFQDLLIYP